MISDAVYETLLAERDEANAKYVAENQNWTSMYEDWRREKARADRLAAALDDIEAQPEDTIRVQAVARSALAGETDQ